MTKKNRKIFYPTILISGFLLMTLQSFIYRNTIIEINILIGIVLTVGIIAFLIDFKNYRKTYEYSGIGLYFYSLMHYMCGFGFIICSIFMLSNYYFAEKNVEKKSYEIIRRTWIKGGSKYSTGEKQPVFTIKYKGKKKELVFYSKYYENMNSYKNVEFETQKGFFGFEILKNKKLN